ncbi:MAG: 4-(cytidine 5'-diphospho)-2-C-methyl-D-erythritol kinase [Firmicutes bacterium]|nr:4-(cytidine 5'-diphospho)-2-C-methyl-D-erythritol kinase [Bacillota bacterium]MBR6503458.1 4-(cytidine 5'-diphospho)-2-C-methyl-D-erythritol kinase [Bacillota bacterium]
MNEITIDAYAKINLALDVLGRLPNGYHEVRMLMQQLELKDRVTLRKTGSSRREIRLTCDNENVPADNTNLAWQAVVLMMDLYEIAEGIEIHIEKRIPMEAGLAGGSADCAAALKAMNILFELDLTTKELCRLGAGLGSDVPFCIQGGTAVAGGTGTDLTQVKGLDPDRYTVLLCKPPEGVSTGEVYRKYSERMADMVTRPHPDIVRLVGDLTADTPLSQAKKDMINVLEYVTGEDLPVIGEIEEAMLEGGAVVSRMTGSGPTVFGIFEERTAAERTGVGLADRFPQTYLTTFR